MSRESLSEKKTPSKTELHHELWLACRTGITSKVEAFLRDGVSASDGSALFEAIIFGRIKIVKLLLAVVDNPLNPMFLKGALDYERVEIVKLLREYSVVKKDEDAIEGAGIQSSKIRL